LPDAEIVPLPDPVPVVQGSFAIFEKPDGGIHVALRMADDSEQHIEVPAFMAAMLKSGETSPLALMNAMRKNRKLTRGA
jgi:hypothetical protein